MDIEGTNPALEALEEPEPARDEESSLRRRSTRVSNPPYKFIKIFLKNRNITILELDLLKRFLLDSILFFSLYEMPVGDSQINNNFKWISIQKL